jgi:hypothetical protein
MLRYKFGSRLPKDIHQELQSQQIEPIAWYSIEGQTLQRLIVNKMEALQKELTSDSFELPTSR